MALAAPGLASLLLALPQAAGAHPVGERSLVAHNPLAIARNADGSDEVRVTIWYPAADGAREEPILIGTADQPLIESGRAAVNAAPASAEPRPTVLLSHGYGGSAKALGWFGTAIAAAGYVVIAVDHPGNNGRDPMTKEGAAFFFDRPGDLLAALKAATEDPVLGQAVDAERLAAAGFSAGGFTALALSGAKVNPRRLEAFCDRNPGDGVCMPQKEFPVPIAEIFDLIEHADASSRFQSLTNDKNSPRISATLVMAPAIVQAIETDSLQELTASTHVVFGDADRVAPGATNGAVVAALVPGARQTIVADATHYDFLGTCTPAGRRLVPLCAEQSRPDEAHSAAISAALTLFAQVVPANAANR